MKFLIFLSLIVFSESCQQSFNNVFLTFVGDTKDDYVSVSMSGDFSKLRGTPSFLGTTYKKYYNPNLKTIMYINGWRANYDSDDSNAMIDAFLTTKSQNNIIYVDWYNYTNNFAYVTSIGAIDGVSHWSFKSRGTNIFLSGLKDNLQHNGYHEQRQFD